MLTNAKIAARATDASKILTYISANISPSIKTHALNDAIAIRKRLPFVLTYVIKSDRLRPVISETNANDGTMKNTTNSIKIIRYLIISQHGLVSTAIVIAKPLSPNSRLIMKIPTLMPSEATKIENRNRATAIKKRKVAGINIFLSHKICCLK